MDQNENHYFLMNGKEYICSQPITYLRMAKGETRGAIYLVKDKKTNEEFVLKLDDKRNTNLPEEFEEWSTQKDDNLAKIIYWQTYKRETVKYVAILMEYYEGETLNEIEKEDPDKNLEFTKCLLTTV